MHIIWGALNCLLSVMFECPRVTFVNALYIQISLAVNCLPATSDQYYHTYVQKWWSGKLFKIKKEIFTSGRFCLTCGSRALFPGGSRMIREGSHMCYEVFMKIPWTVLKLQRGHDSVLETATFKVQRGITKKSIKYKSYGSCILHVV